MSIRNSGNCRREPCWNSWRRSSDVTGQAGHAAGGQSGLDQFGHRAIIVISLLVAQGLVDLGVAIGISSLRMDRMPEVLIDCMVRSGVRSCTVAPEAGSERLQQFIRKEMTEEVILTGVEMLWPRACATSNSIR